MQKNKTKKESYGEKILATLSSIELKINSIIEKRGERKQYSDHVLISTSRKELVSLNVRSIVYITVKDGVVTIHHKNGSGTIKIRSIKQVEQKLNPKYFVRISRQYLVNRNAINKIFFVGKIPYYKLKDQKNTELPGTINRFHPNFKKCIK